MANTPDIGVGNLDLHQQLNNLLVERNKILEQQNAVLTAHNQLIAAMTQRLKDQQAAAGGAAKANAELNASLGVSAKSAEETAQSIDELAKSLDEGSKSSFSFMGALKTVGSTLSGVVSVAFGAVEVISNLAKSFFTYGLAIASIPFGILNGLIEWANTLPSGINPILLQIEEIRKAFGDIAQNEGKLLYGSIREIRGEMRNFAGTGLSVRRMFGYGPEGIAKAMQEFQAIAEALGPSLNRLKDEITGNIPELLALTRGFTGSADATAAMLKHAKSLGRDGTKEIIRATSIAQRMGKQYGINAKVIGKAVGEMSKDISNFGSLSIESMTAAAVYASKLGLEIQDLGNVMNKFLNFEDAAKGAAEMAQAFGMNVDTMQLMKGGPEAIEEMRRAFFASGRTIESLSNAERKLFEQQTSLTGASLEAAFAAETQGLSYSQIADSAEEAGSIQEQQLKVMKELAKSIDRVFGSGGDQFKSFGAAMSKGFMDGMTRAKPMYELLRNIRRALISTYWAFRDIGRIFVTSFPGLQKFLSSLAKFFSRDNFGKLLGSFKKDFTALMSDLSDPSKKDSAIARFMDNIKKSFGNFFSSNSSILKGVVDGGKTVLLTVWSIFNQILLVGLETISKGLETFLSSDFLDTIGAGVNGATSELFAVFGKLWQQLGQAWDRIWPVLKPRLIKLGVWIKDTFIEILESVFGLEKGQIVKSFDSFIESFKEAAPYIAGLMLLPLAGPLLSAMGGLLGGVFMAAGKLISNFALGPLMTGLGSISGMVNGSAAAAGAAGGAAGAVAGPTFFAMLKSASAVLGVVAVLLPAMVLYIHMITPLIQTLDYSMFPKLGLTLLALAGMAVTGAIMIATLSIVDKIPKDYKSLIIGIGVIGLVILALTGVTAIAVSALEDFTPDTVEKISKALLSMSLMAVGMTVAALAIGAIIIGGSIFGGLAIVAGITAMASVIIGTIKAMMPVIKLLMTANIPNPDSFKAVADVLVGLMSSMGNFAGAVLDIVSLAPDSGWLTPSEQDSRDFVNSLNAINRLIGQLIEPLEKTKEIISMIMSTLFAGGVSESKIKAATDFVSSILPPLFQFMGSSTEIFSKIASVATDKDGKIDGEKLKLVVDAFSNVSNVLFSTDLSGKIHEAVNQMLTMTTSLKVPENFENNSKLITSSIGFITSFIEIGSKIIGLIGKEIPVDDVEEGISTVGRMDLEGIFGVLDRIARSVPENMYFIAQGIEGLLSIPALSSRGVGGKLDALKSMFEAASGFIEMINGLGPMTEAQGKFFKSVAFFSSIFSNGSSSDNIKRAISGIASIALAGREAKGFNKSAINLLEDVFDGAADLIKTIQGTDAVDSAMLTTKLTGISSAVTNPWLIATIGAIGNIGIVAMKVKGFNVATAQLLANTFSGAADLIKTFAGKENGVGAEDLTSAITTGLENMNTMFVNDKIEPIIKNLGKISKLAVGVNVDGLSNLASVAEKTAYLGQSIGGFVSHLPKDANEMTQIVIAYVEGFNQLIGIGEAFASSKSFEALMSLSSQLSDAKTVTVEANGVTYTFNVNVTIDAEKLAEKIIKTDQVKNQMGIK